MSATFSIARETSDDGSFRRQPSAFRRWVSEDGSTGFPLEGGRYHLYVSRACPWAHRTIIARRLMGLEAAVGIAHVDPVRDGRGWRFSGGEYTDPVGGFSFLSQAYVASDPDFDARASTPVLWDRRTGVIVNNESGDILRMFGTVFAPLAEHPVDLCPEPLRERIDQLNERIYDSVNNAVYAAGFATRQAAYEREIERLFAGLDELEERLGGSRFLFGAEPVETDWRLFTTLVRFDPVYQVHFKCSRRKLIEYPNLWGYARDLFAWPGVAETVSFREIRAHYYRTHPAINPSGIEAVMPAADWHAPHGRERLG